MKYLLDENRCTIEDIYVLCIEDRRDIGIIFTYHNILHDYYEKDNKLYIDVPDDKTYMYSKGYLNPEINMDYETVWKVGDGGLWHWAKPISEKWKKKRTLVMLRCYKLPRGTRIPNGIEITGGYNEVQFNITKTKEILEQDDNMYVIIKDIDNLPWKPHSVIRVTMKTLPSWFMDRHKCLYDAIDNVECSTPHYNIMNNVIRFREEMFNKKSLTKKGADIFYKMLDVFVCTGYFFPPPYTENIDEALKRIIHHRELLLSTSQ